MNKAEAQAALYDTDVPVDGGAVQFRPYSTLELTGCDDPDAVGVSFSGEEKIHFFSEWSRSQLLSHVGTREKWFLPISAERQAGELQHRLPLIRKHVFRRMRSADGVTLPMIRGIVSQQFADIPDTHVLRELFAASPDAEIVSRISDQTDRALFVYITLDEHLQLPDSPSRLRPGVVVRNSEVGFSSLFVCPFVWIEGTRGIATLTRHDVFRKIHRGQAEDLKSSFAKAATEIRALWGDLQARLTRLANISYATEDEAVESLQNVMARAKARKSLTWRTEQIFRKKNGHAITGLRLFESVMEAISEEPDLNVHHDASAVAGAFLAYLT